MIDDCPSCGYSLVGLPDEHRCPECGLEYERDSLVFTEPRRIWKVLVVANAGMFLICLVSWLFRGASTGIELWLVGLFGMMSAGWIWHLLKKRRAILVSPNTIRIVERDAQQEVYQIGDVGQIRWNFVNGDILIERPNGTELVVIKSRFLASNIQAWRIVKTVRCYVQLGRDARST